MDFVLDTVEMCHFILYCDVFENLVASAETSKDVRHCLVVWLLTFLAHDVEVSLHS